MNELIETRELQNEISPVLAQANAIVVSTAQEYEVAADYLKELKTAQAKVIAFFAPIKKKAHEAWKAITSKETEVLEPLKNAEMAIKTKLVTFQREAEKKRLAEQQRLQNIADINAQKERDRLQKQAEKLKTPELREQRIAESQEVIAPVITVQSEKPKVMGIVTRKIWKAELISKQEFVQAATANENLMAFIEIDMGRLNKFASATKGEVKYPGVRFYEEEIIGSGTK